MLVKLLLRHFQSILTQNIVSVACKDLWNGEFAKFKIDECLKTLESLQFKCATSLEAILNYFLVLFKQNQQILNHLRLVDKLFYTETFTFRVIGLDSLDEIQSLLLDKLLVQLINRFETGGLVFEQTVHEFETFEISLHNHFSKTLRFAE